MSPIEDRLRDAYRAAAETIQPETIPDLTERPGPSPARSKDRSRWARALIPLSAAAAVTALAVVSSLLGSGNGHPGGTLARPVGAPRFFVQVLNNNLLEVYEIATAKATATITPPSGTYFNGLVAATADNRTFLAGAVRGSSPASPTPCVTRFYRFRLSDAGEPGPLIPLHITVPGDAYQYNTLSVTPDGRTIAYATNFNDCNSGKYGTPDGIAVINVRTGQLRFWTSGKEFAITTVALSADGRELLFSRDDGQSYGARILPTSAPTGAVDQRSRLVFQRPLPLPPKPGSSPLQVCQSPSQSVFEPSPRPGMLTYHLYPLVSGQVIADFPGWWCAGSRDASGRYLLMEIGATGINRRDRLVLLDLRTRELTYLRSGPSTIRGGWFAAAMIAW